MDDVGTDPLDTGALDAMEAEVADVERALARLDDRSYGTCEVCGQCLDESLLHERPAARHCAEHLPMTLGS
ncbi:MAG TPA: hypothetical protein VK386_09030 [Acidimicrobiales bacterium]|nr:hypothetical protein [Acidimicrobiales bacterium]